MGVMRNGVELPEPTINGVTANAIINGVEIWDNIPQIYIEFTAVVAGDFYLNNMWSTDIKYEIDNSGVEVLPVDERILLNLGVGSKLRIYETIRNSTFRNWTTKNYSAGTWDLWGILQESNNNVFTADLTVMPSMDHFTETDGGTTLGNNAFAAFSQGCIRDILDGFITNNITSVGHQVFRSFGEGYNEDAGHLYHSKLRSIPDGSFNFENLIETGQDFLRGFIFAATNFISLPDGAFDFPSLITAGERFLSEFNRYGQLTFMYENTFRFPLLETTGSQFCKGFNYNGLYLTNLPEGSFQFPELIHAGSDFCISFNANNGSLHNLPDGSFTFPNVTFLGAGAFMQFNYTNGHLKTLPANSFNFQSLTSVGVDFCREFNRNNGNLTCLGVNTFNFPSLTSNDLTGYFAAFNIQGGKLVKGNENTTIVNHNAMPTDFYYWDGTSTQSETVISGESFSYNSCVPVTGDHITIEITAPGDAYIKNQWTGLIKYTLNDGNEVILPEDGATVSFVVGDTLKIYEIEQGITFRDWANRTGNGGLLHGSSTCRGIITNMPPMNRFTIDDTGVELGNNAFRNFGRGCVTNINHGFDTSELVTIHDGAFWDFAWNSIDYTAVLTSLPIGSFKFDNLSVCGNNAFQGFLNSLTDFNQLPLGSFNFPLLSATADNFCAYFNNNGSLKSLPANSFNFPALISSGNYFFYYFNDSGQLNSMGTNTFRFPTLTTLGSDAFHNYNHNGSLELLSTGSFSFPALTTIGDYFCTSFNNSGQLRCLVPGSFSAPLLDNVNNYYMSNFNTAGMLPRGNEDIQIVNHGPSNMIFSYWSGNNQVNTDIASGSSMGYYSCGTPTGEYIEITVTEDGNLHLENHWATDIIYNINNGINRAISGFTDLGTLVTGDIIRVYESHPSLTFRSWRGDDILGIINQGTGYCNITRMPPMDSFTTADSNGTVLGWCAFRYFARGPITHIMDGFDTSKIVEMGDHCFEEFARGNNERTVVETLPAESFKFPELITAGHYVLSNFMSDQTALVALPLYSFRFPKLTTVGDNFCTSFASNSMLACIPYGSFDPVNLSSYGANYIQWLFNNSRMRIDNSPYTTITNRCTGNIVMYYWNGSNQSVTVTPGNYVSYHSCSIVVPDAFTITNAISVTPKWTVAGDPLLYTLNNGLSWAEAMSGTSITVTGDNIKFVGDGRTGLFTDAVQSNAWSITGDDVELSGNINTLLDHNNTITTISNRAFIYMFYDCNVITETENLVMPATTLGSSAYAYMFYECNNLLNAPDIKATVVDTNSCYRMFMMCTNLVNGPPVLPALSLGTYSYYEMFMDCMSLTSTPDILATSMGQESCFQMFAVCPSLVSMSDIRATTVGIKCCDNMFWGCSSLLHTPDTLPAMTVTDDCYNGMFKGCTSLLDAPSLPATTLGTNCYQFMFQGCTKLVNVPSTLPAMVLRTNCYSYMFNNCTSLVTGPNLPFVGTLPAQCYEAMFQGCSSLLVAPNNDYYTTRTAAQTSMFDGAENVEEPLAWCRIPTNFGGGGSYTGCTDAFTITNALTVTPRWTISLYTLQYSLDNGTSWANASNGTAITLTGENVKFRRASTGSETGIFSASNDSNAWGITWDEEIYGENPEVILSGNLNTILDNTNPAKPELRNYAYAKMFFECEAIAEAGNLKLPSMTLGNYCYTYMFSGCINLRTAPKLPATALKTGCYSHMFGKTGDTPYKTTSIVVAPKLPATTLQPYCYDSMFSGCFSLEKAPLLPATTLATYCYHEMFYDCLSLIDTPELPATITAPSCYRRMFLRCSNLENPPNKLPAMTITESCYREMFSSCMSLEKVPSLPALTLAPTCYQEMYSATPFLYMSSSSFSLPATTLAPGCYKQMWMLCQLLLLIPGGLLPATTLEPNCYEGMFMGCAKLGNMCNLPSTTLANSCYSQMFKDCKELATAAVLPAPRENLKQNCYYQMFMNILWLETAPSLPGGGNLQTGCYQEMFSGCYNLINAPNCDDYTTRTPAQAGMFTDTEKVVNPMLWCNIPLTFGGFGGLCKGVLRISGATSVTPRYTTGSSLTNSLEYRLANETSWTTKWSGNSITTNGQDVLMRGTGRTSLYEGLSKSNNAWTIQGENVRLSGSLNALLDWQALPEEINITANTFAYMFAGCAAIIDISTLLLKSETLAPYCYYNMFQECTNLITTPNLPADIMEPYCYFGMFESCTKLTETPWLQASTLASNCYKNMLSKTAITSPPGLPATVMAEHCYENLFYNTETLLIAPSLNAITLAESCYNGMFNGCISLTNAPELPATVMTVSCYNEMFSGCINLTGIPTLSGTTLAEYCYNQMFYGCAKILTTPALPAPIENLQAYCYNQMFMGCASIREGPSLPGGGNLVANCYTEMFKGCGDLEIAPNCDDYTTRTPAQTDMFTGAEKVINPIPWCEIPANFGGFGGYCNGFLRISGATEVWARYTTSGPSLQYRLASQTTWDTTSSGWGKSTNGEDILFRGTGRTSLYTALNKSNNAWEIDGDNVKITGSLNALLDYQVDAADINITANTFAYMFAGCEEIANVELLEFESETLAPYCYYNIFQECIGLRKPPILPAMTMVPYCYFGMFEGCSSLTETPVLPATTLASNCYKNMLSMTGILWSPELPATVMAEFCYDNLFYKTHTLLTVPALPATTLAESCYNGMFYECTSLTNAPELPATVMAKQCYEFMFRGCTSITSLPNNFLPSTQLAESCYRYMFQETGLIDITNFTLPATELTPTCYPAFFQDCAELTVINPDMLPATVLTEGCYDQMFYRCEKLVVAPNLPITTLALYSCRRMFYYCTALQGIPGADTYTQITTLPADSVLYMFSGDTNIILPITYAQIPDGWK
jgi:hypothetical protein